MANTFSEGKIEVTNIHTNVEQTLISVTEDKLRLILNSHLEIIESKKQWIAPLGIILTIIVVLSSSSFNDFILSKDTWQAVFVIVLLLSIGWLIHALLKLGKSSTIDDVINKIKNLQ